MIEHILAFIGGWFLISLLGGVLWGFLRHKKWVRIEPATDLKPEPEEKEDDI
jgi:hypothetical protein